MDARWGTLDGTPPTSAMLTLTPILCTSKDSKITVTGSDLTASVTDVLPNETITITGNGFGSQTCIAVSKIQLDGVAVQVDEESTFSGCDLMTATVPPGAITRAWKFPTPVSLSPPSQYGRQDTRESADNPTLISGTHTLDVEDSAGFVGSTTLTIAEPTISVVPDVVGPRDYVVITGTNWPIDNTDNSNSGLVTVVISDDANDAHL